MQEHQNSDSEIALSALIENVPGKVAGAAKICNVSVRAVYKWISHGRLPRTDYTGETNYAEKLAVSTGGKHSASEFLSCNKNIVTKGYPIHG